jgi:cobalt/nickel transport system ATP-binding protein
MIELQNVNFSWPNSSGVLNDLTLSLTSGEKLVLLGANGSGKSTLLKLLNGLLFATSGRMLFEGREMTAKAFHDRAWSRRFRQRCVLLFQHPEAMLFNPTVRDEITYGPRQLGLPDVPQRLHRWTDELGLQDVLDLPPYRLSGGEKQKVALASLLALDPDLLLLDEPMANLDPRSSGWLIDHLLDTQSTVVVSTHNLSMAAELGRRCIILDPHGSIRYDGAVEQALNDLELLDNANLVHRHRHRHGRITHSHTHVHDWE